MPFISLNDLQPSQFAFSFTPNPNIRGYCVNAAFMALNSEKLCEHVDDAFYYDFWDDMVPHYKENRKKKTEATKT